MGFSQSKYDYSLFVCGFGSTFIALLVYMHDIIITEASSIDIEKLKSHLNDVFHLKDLGSLQYFLDLEITRSFVGISLFSTPLCVATP